MKTGKCSPTYQQLIKQRGSLHTNTDNSQISTIGKETYHIHLSTNSTHPKILRNLFEFLSIWYDYFGFLIVLIQTLFNIRLIAFNESFVKLYLNPFVKCTLSLSPDVFRGNRKGGLGANGLKIAYRLPWSLIIPLSWNREGAVLTIAGDCIFIKPSLIWQLYIWRWPLRILKEAEINNDEWQAHSNKSPNHSKNNQTNKASKFAEQHRNKKGIQKY